MLLVRFHDPAVGRTRIGVQVDGRIGALPVSSMSELLHGRLDEVRTLVEGDTEPVGPDVLPMPPVDGRMEVWAAGVTYRRSRQARIEESATADVYSRVYEAQRPELFFKSSSWRVVTDGEPIGVREDAMVSVPEPELAVVANAWGEVIGYTVCNDVSSRDIEGDNPLYLPQAKIYAGACALAAGIRPAWEIEATNLPIRCTVYRGDDVVWAAATDTGELARPVEDLLAWLVKAQTFPDGVVLSTGTGIVPDLDMALLPGDVVQIEIDEVGTLRNCVRRGRDSFAWLTHRDPRHRPAPEGPVP